MFSVYVGAHLIDNISVLSSFALCTFGICMRPLIFELQHDTSLFSLVICIALLYTSAGARVSDYITVIAF